MKKSAFLLFAGLIALPGAIAARNSKVLLPLERIMASPRFQEVVGTDVKFVFGDTALPAGARYLGPVATNKKTNAFNKSDEEACEWVFLSAMKALHARARKEGADAVIGIVSNNLNEVFSSATECECRAGGVVAGVALKGMLVKTGE